MRILHILTTIYQGGVRSIVLDLVKAQIKAGHEVSILCLLNEDRYFNNTEDFKETGVTIIRGTYKNSRNPLHIFVIRKYLKDFDIAHIHLFPNQLFSKVACQTLSSKHQPILITTEHSTFNNRRNYPILRNLDRWFYKFYSKIICISKPAEENLKKWLNDEEINKKIVTINNGVDIQKFATAENHLQEVIPFDQSKKYVVMVARMDYPKDPLTLVKSLSLCSDNIELILIGAGSLTKSIKEEAAKLNLKNRIHLLGTRDDVPQLLKGCAIGVISTKWEGFGLVAVEYMAAGLPVLATDVEGLKDIVGDKESLFPYKDWKILGEKIEKLINDPKLWKQKKFLFEKRCNLFSVNEMISKYAQVYSEVLKN